MYKRGYFFKKYVIQLSSYSFIHQLLYIFLEIMPYPVRYVFYKIRLQAMGKGVYIDYGCDFRYHHRISIGDGTIINKGCKIFASYYRKDSTIKIGRFCKIAPYVKFFSAGHDIGQVLLPNNGDSITVGDYVWIGGSSTILQGVTIGEGAIIGAGSVVINDVEPYSIVGGVPAKFIKKRELKEAQELDLSLL